MIIDKKGRLFGKFNLLDALIALVAAALLLFLLFGFVKGAFSSVLGKTANEEGETEEGVKTKIVYTVEITKEKKEFFDKIKVGDKIYDPVTEKVLGEIVVCDVKTARYLTENKVDLKYEMTEVEGRYDGKIKIKADAMFNYPDFSVGGEAIKIGSFVTRETNEVAMSGHVIDLEYDEKLVEGIKDEN